MCGELIFLFIATLCFKHLTINIYGTWSTELLSFFIFLYLFFKEKPWNSFLICISFVLQQLKKRHTSTLWWQLVSLTMLFGRVSKGVTRTASVTRRTNPRTDLEHPWLCAKPWSSTDRNAHVASSNRWTTRKLMIHSAVHSTWKTLLQVFR